MLEDKQSQAGRARDGVVVVDVVVMMVVVVKKKKRRRKGRGRRRRKKSGRWTVADFKRLIWRALQQGKRELLIPGRVGSPSKSVSEDSI